MTELEAKLTQETDDALERRRRNADRVAREQTGTTRGGEAERLLELIEVEFDRRHLPGMMASFLEKFPLGFSDPKHLDQERYYKLTASRYCRAELTPEAFAEVRNGGSPDALLVRIRKLVQMTNLIQGGFEKPKLLDAISDPKYTRGFLTGLDDLLHGAGDASERLERFSGVLAGMELRKWTYATYFLFLSDSVNCMYVKPEDMIDVQSFIWHMAPTGKFSES